MRVVEENVQLSVTDEDVVISARLSPDSLVLED
jgi:hypothetical protein